MCVNFLEKYITLLNSNISSELIELFNKNFKEKQSIMFMFGSSKEDLFKKEFELIKKQFKKSEFSDNLEKFKKTYLYLIKVTFNLNDFYIIKGDYDCNNYKFHIMNLYNLFRMFVKKDIWKDKKIQSKRLSEKCKTSDYPKNIISYQGARHVKYYTEFIKKYYNLKSDQYYESSKEYQKETDENFRYVQINCEIKNGVIMPKFYNIN